MACLQVSFAEDMRLDLVERWRRRCRCRARDAKSMAFERKALQYRWVALRNSFEERVHREVFVVRRCENISNEIAAVPLRHRAEATWMSQLLVDSRHASI